MCVACLRCAILLEWFERVVCRMGFASERLFVLWFGVLGQVGLN